MNRNLNAMLASLWGEIKYSQRRQIYFLVVLMIIASILEGVSIGAVFPFISILADPTKINSYLSSNVIGMLANGMSNNEILWMILILYCALAVVSGALRLTLNWYATKISVEIGSALSADAYQNILKKNYLEHLSYNSSELIDTIFNKSNAVVFNIIFPILISFTGLVLLVVIGMTVFLIAPIESSTMAIAFICVYYLFNLFLKKKLNMNGEVIARESVQSMKMLQEGFGGIRDVIIYGFQNTYLSNYRASITKLRSAQGSNQFLSSSPRFVVETLGIVIISFIALYTSSDKSTGQNNVIPVLGVVAMAAQRMLPLLQQIYNSWASVVGNKAVLEKLINILESKRDELNLDNAVGHIEFTSELTLVEADFRYPCSSKDILSNINLKIKKGSVVGIVGESGGGKSTLVDIIMGLVCPTNGSFLVDKLKISQRNASLWRKNISHVPQTIFLSDCSIAENIALGINKKDISYSRLHDAAYKAQLLQFVDSLPKGFETVVGERGITLSGGQRQRIGIARAIYRNTDVLVLDEATSALDSETEQRVIRALHDSADGKTVLMIAHRLSTLEGCDMIIEIKCGKIIKTCSFADFIGKRRVGQNLL